MRICSIENRLRSISISKRVYSLMYDILNEHLNCYVGDKGCVMERLYSNLSFEFL